jgi:CheY-like chemotaxis protein
MPFQVPRRTILSVDDDEVNQIVITSFLEGAGFAVVQAMDGEECLRYLEKAFSDDLEIKEETPDLIFLDVVMPGLDGYKVCREIRARFSSTIPVIMISARMTKDDIIHGLTVGLANDYLTKPFDRALMLAKVESRIAIADSVKLLEAHQRDAFCAEINRSVRPVISVFPAGIVSLVDSSDMANAIGRMSAGSGSSPVRILEIQFGHCIITAQRHEDVLEACLASKLKALCLVLSPDRDVFRMIRILQETPACERVRVTERFFSHLGPDAKANISSKMQSISVVREYGDISARLNREIDFLEKYTASRSAIDRQLSVEQHKFTLMKELLDSEQAVNQLKAGIAFEQSSQDALEYRLSKARSYRSDFAQKLGLVDDMD